MPVRPENTIRRAGAYTIFLFGDSMPLKHGLGLRHGSGTPRFTNVLLSLINYLSLIDYP